MKTKMKGKRSHSEWLKRMADAENSCDAVTTGGLASDLRMPLPTKLEMPPVFGLLIKFARRERQMSVEKLAKKADVDLSELIAIERKEEVIPTPRTVFQLAKTLHLSMRKLMVISGLAETRDEAISQAVLRFAARSEPTAQLSKEEREAYEEFIKVLVDTSDGD